MPASTSANDFKIADAELVRSVIQRVATGPELSKNISYDEARAMMHALLAEQIDPVQAGVFLIGLRMKRETDEEVKGVLDALRDRMSLVSASVPNVVSIADPYNGFNRTLQGSLFALPVLAACGINVYSHGVELSGPKYGVTHHTILRVLGGNPLRTVDEVSQRVSDSSIGWGYTDQSVFCPALYQLNDLRTRIVKRPVLSTTEVLLSPIKGSSATHLVTGYVHKPYRETYAMLARHTGYESLLLVRGTEGGIIPSFRGRGNLVRYWYDEPDMETAIDMAEMDLDRDYRAADIPDSTPPAPWQPDRIGMKWDIHALSTLCAEAGLRALDGETGPFQDAAVLGAALVLWHTANAGSLAEGANMAREVIRSGEATRRLQAGLV